MPTQDEYWTSQKCHKCKDPHTFLVDGPRYREKACVTCGPINRDLNAAANLEFVWTWWLEHRQRPEYLQPPAPDGDAPKGRRRRAKAGAGAGGAKAAPSKAGGAKAPSKAGGAKAKPAGAQGAAAVSPQTKRKRTAAVRGGSESGAAAGGTST